MAARVLAFEAAATHQVLPPVRHAAVAPVEACILKPHGKRLLPPADDTETLHREWGLGRRNQGLFDGIAL